MPELPEVETTRRGIAPHLTGQHIAALILRDTRLRWPLPPELPARLVGQPLREVGRRGKYLLLTTASGTLIVHLGMSGSLRLVAPDAPLRPHDHVDIVFSHGLILRFHDPRRFGGFVWTEEDPLIHPLLKKLGPEPFAPDFSARGLYHASRDSRLAVKAWLMSGRQVAGVGNIYANEALFQAGIRPQRPAASIGLPRYHRLVEAIRGVLANAIAQGGTTLRDFVNGAGHPGYFQHTLCVYGRAGQACKRCGHTIQTLRIAARSSFYCPRCQR